MAQQSEFRYELASAQLLWEDHLATPILKEYNASNLAQYDEIEDGDDDTKVIAGAKSAAVLAELSFCNAAVALSMTFCLIAFG